MPAEAMDDESFSYSGEADPLTPSERSDEGGESGFPDGVEPEGESPVEDDDDGILPPGGEVELPDDKEIDTETAEALQEVESDAPKKEKNARFQKRIKGLNAKYKEAAEIARASQEEIAQLRRQLAEQQKSAHSSGLERLVAQEKSLSDRLKQLKDDNDLAAAIDVAAELADVRGQKRMLESQKVEDSPGPDTSQQSIHDIVWLRSNPDWDRDPEVKTATEAAFKIAAKELTPGTAEFWERVDEEREAILDGEPTKPAPTQKGKARPKSPPVSGGSPARRPQTPRGPVMTKEDRAILEGLGLDPNDKEVRATHLRNKQRTARKAR